MSEKSSFGKEIIFSFRYNKSGPWLGRIAVGMKVRPTGEDYERLVNYDQLTEVGSRYAYQRDSRRFFERSQQSDEENRLALVLADVDYLKKINDTLGYEKGDLVLKTAANQMRQSVRVNDPIYRLGGDEFVVLVPFAKSHPLDIQEYTENRINQPVRQGLSELPFQTHGLGITSAGGVLEVGEQYKDLFDRVNAQLRELKAARSSGTINLTDPSQDRFTQSIQLPD